MNRIKGKQILCVLLALVFCMGTAMPVKADSISDMTQDKKELEEQKKAEEAEKARLSSQLDSILADIKETEAQLSAKEVEIDQVETELAAAKAVEEKQYQDMKLRIKYMYENGDTGFIEMLIESETMTEFLNKAEYISTISETDRNMLTQFQKTREEIEEKEKKLEEEKAKLEEIQIQLAAEKKSVDNLLASQNKTINDLSADINALIKKIQDAEDRRQQSQSGGIQAGGGSSQIVIQGNGTLSNPCPAARISSEFGPRKSPTAGASSNHKGRDYAAPSGTPIYASADGKVTTSTYNSIRGYYVVVTHDNGLQTWYQHCSKIYVTVGQRVSRGQNIAAVGSTGIVTGAHLHYEVHVNGTPVDPRKYL